MCITHFKQAMCDAGVKHMGDRKLRQSHRLYSPICVYDGFSRPIFVDDGIFRYPCVVIL
jgi:hypothetical protein